MKGRRQRTPVVPVRPTSAVLAHGDLKIDLDCFRVSFRGRPVHLGPTPYRLLAFLLRRPGIHSRTELLAALWPPGTQIRPSTVDMHILRLRAALAGAGGIDLIVSVRGQGYGLREASLVAADPPNEHRVKASSRALARGNDAHSDS